MPAELADALSGRGTSCGDLRRSGRGCERKQPARSEGKGQQGSAVAYVPYAMTHQKFEGVAHAVRIALASGGDETNLGTPALSWRGGGFSRSREAAETL